MFSKELENGLMIELVNVEYYSCRTEEYKIMIALTFKDNNVSFVLKYLKLGSPG